MRTGSFDQPTSLLSIRDARLPHNHIFNPSSGSMDMRAIAFEVKSPPSSALLRFARRLQAYNYLLHVSAS